MNSYENEWDRLKSERTFWNKPVMKIWEFGNIGIAEAIRPHRMHKGETWYAIFVDGDATASTTNTLDEALAEALAVKYHGNNTQAGYLFMRMIGAVEDER